MYFPENWGWICSSNSALIFYYCPEACKWFIIDPRHLFNHLPLYGHLRFSWFFVIILLWTPMIINFFHILNYFLMVDFYKGNCGVKRHWLFLFFLKILSISCQFGFHICYSLKYTSNSSCQNSPNEFITMAFREMETKQLKKQGKWLIWKCKLPRTGCCGYEGCAGVCSRRGLWRAALQPGGSGTDAQSARRNAGPEAPRRKCGVSKNTPRSHVNWVYKK